MLVDDIDEAPDELVAPEMGAEKQIRSTTYYRLNTNEASERSDRKRAI